MKLPGRRPPEQLGDEAVEPLVLPEPPNPDFYDPAWDAWKPKRTVPTKYVLGSIAAVIVVLLVAYLIRDLTASSPVTKQVSKVSLTPTTFTIARTPGDPAPIIFSGEQSKTTSSFTIPSGLAVLSATCECTGHPFVVSVTGADGTVVHIPINSLGSVSAGIFAGSTNLGVGPGTYAFKIEASGKWTTRITFPSPTLAPISIPRGFGSSGPAVLGPFAANQSLGILYSIPPGVGSSSLQVLNTDGTTGPTVFNVSSTPSILYANLPAQPKQFYLQMSDTSAGWTLRVQAGK